MLKQIFDKEIEAFLCPSCEANIDKNSLYFAHFFIPSYPYNKDLVIELSYSDEHKIICSFSILESNGQTNDISNTEEISKGIMHPSKKAFQKGLEALQNKKVKKAIKMFRRALRSYSSWEEALIEIARCYLLLGKNDISKKILKRVLRLHPENLNALLLKSWFYYLKDDLNKSEKICRKIISINSNFADAYYNLALIELERGEIENSISYLEETLNIEPGHTDASKLLYLIIESDNKKSIN